MWKNFVTHVWKREDGRTDNNNNNNNESILMFECDDIVKKETVTTKSGQFSKNRLSIFRFDKEFQV